MSELNWQTGIPGSVGTGGAPLYAGTTAAFPTPSGGGSRTYSWRAADASINGAHAVRVDAPNFAPIPGNNGGSIRGAIYRADGSSAEDHSVFLFFQLQEDDTSGTAYLLGLSPEVSSHLVLVKGPLSSGIPTSAEKTDGVVRRSTETYGQGTWLHVRLDVVVNPNGDVVLNTWVNDLTANDVTAPTWVAVDEMSGVIDDVLGWETGTPGLNVGGRMGFAYHATSSGTAGAVDHIRVARNNVP